MAYFDNAATTYPKPECVYVALDKANRKFKKRFDYVETQMEENNIPWDDEHIDEREKFWEAAKKNAR